MVRIPENGILRTGITGDGTKARKGRFPEQVAQRAVKLIGKNLLLVGRGIKNVP